MCTGHYRRSIFLAPNYNFNHLTTQRFYLDDFKFSHFCLKAAKYLLEQGVEANVTYSKEALEGTKKQFELLQVENVEDSDFYAEFR